MRVTKKTDEMDKYFRNEGGYFYRFADFTTK